MVWPLCGDGLAPLAEVAIETALTIVSLLKTGKDPGGDAHSRLYSPLDKEKFSMDREQSPQPRKEGDPFVKEESISHSKT